MHMLQGFGTYYVLIHTYSPTSPNTAYCAMNNMGFTMFNLVKLSLYLLLTALPNP